MAVTIKRGDECPLAVRVELNGQAVDISEVETAEFCLGKRLRKLYPGRWSTTRRRGNSSCR